VAEIKLRIVGFPHKTDVLQESTMKAENIRDIIKHLEIEYPPDYYTFAIFLNGKSVDARSRNLRDGDEVVIAPVMSGG
jgi:molybdopterin converting factor small subunit